MANKNFNTQIRKKFDKGSSPIKRGGLNFKTPAQKSHEKLKKQFNPSDYNITSAGGTKKTKSKDMLDRNPNKTMSPETKKKLRDAMERRRQFNKKRELEKKENRREKTGKAKQPIGKPPLKKEPLRKPKDEKKPRINKLKDKLKKVGDMKVKDAAKVVGKAALATTPIGAAKNIAGAVNKNFKFQSPIVRKNKKFGGR